jgi:hypothetical protein
MPVIADPEKTRLSVYHRRDALERLAEIARAEHRTTTGEVRRLIDERIATYDAQGEDGEA